MSIFLLPEYHQAVTRALSALDWVRQARAYPEEKTVMIVPAVFVSIPGWGRADTNGALTLDLDVDFYVVCDRVTTEDNPEPEVYARSAALDLCQWLEGNCFGLDNVAPMVFQDCQRDGFDPEMDDYLVFRLTTTQQVTVGDDPYAPNDADPLKAVWLGKVPEVGRAHIDDYRLIYRSMEKTDGSDTA